ncbi:MAG: hypothetical protein K0S07_409 [Chlamydiales bacterium]|jgi:8-oxo-dGTP pyrophosphatase MutT (NUDIX family)|nr:hypothetical protein [Chlamydiales bacterium]
MLNNFLIYFSYIFLLIIPSHSFAAAGVFPLALYKGAPTPYVKEGEPCILFGERKADPKRWADFGGMREKGENSMQTAARELYEETGTYGLTGNTIGIDLCALKITSRSYTLYLTSLWFCPSDSLKKNAKEWALEHHGKVEVTSFDWVTLEQLMASLSKKSRYVTTTEGKTIKIWWPRYQMLQQAYEDLGERKMYSILWESVRYCWQ